MALSSITYEIDSGTAGQTSFDLSFAGPSPGFISRANIWLYINDVQTDVGGGYGANGFVWVSDSRVTLKNYTPVAGDVIKFRRIIPSTDILYDFENGSGLTEERLNNQNLSLLYLVHEIYDGYGGFPITEPIFNFVRSDHTAINDSDLTHTHTATVTNEMVFQNGLLLRETSDYTVSGFDVTLVSAEAADQISIFTF